MNKIRVSITTKILATLLGLALISLAAFAYIALVDMDSLGDYALENSSALGNRALTDSATALLEQAEESLQNLARDQAAISNAMLERVEAETRTVAKYASALWRNPAGREYRRSYSQEEKPYDIYSASVYILAAGGRQDNVKQELAFSASMDDIFIPVYANDPMLQRLYIGTQSGIFRGYPWLTGVSPTFDHRLRPWYIRATKTGRLGWTKPYVDAGGGGVAVSCSAPIYGAEERLMGVVGSDITLKTLQEQIVQTQIGEDGYAFLIDNKGKVIFRPGITQGHTRWDESFRTENLLETANPEIRRTIVNMTEGKTGVARVPMDGGEKYVGYAPITSTGWSLGIVMPVDEIVSQVEAAKKQIAGASAEASRNIDRQIARARLQFIGILIGLMAAIAIIAWFLARRITRPILALDRGTSIVGGGNLDYRLNIRTGDEIEQLAGAFNRMTADLKIHITELQKTTAAKERIESELRVAHDIQNSMLPRIYPPFPDREEFGIYATMIPAREVGGDFYDFFFSTKNRLYFLIGDVCGKGIPAALFMVISKILIKTEGLRSISPGEILNRVNEILYPDNDRSMFFTAFCGVIDTETGTIEYANGGHLPPLLSRQGMAFEIIPVPKGLVVGPMPEVHYEHQRLQMEPGDTFFLYTDGVTEATDPENQLYSEARLKARLNAIKDWDVKDLVEAIRSDIVDFAHGAEQADDITMMVLRYNGPKTTAPRSRGKS